MSTLEIPYMENRNLAISQLVAIDAEALEWDGWAGNDFIHATRSIATIGRYVMLGEDLIGYIFYSQHRAGYVDLDRMMIRPRFQRKGHGTSLLGLMKKKAAEQHRVIRVMLPERNMDLLRFFGQDQGHFAFNLISKNHFSRPGIDEDGISMLWHPKYESRYSQLFENANPLLKK